MNYIRPDGSPSDADQDGAMPGEQPSGKTAAEPKKKPEKKGPGPVRTVILIAAVIMLIVSGYKLFTIFSEYYRGTESYSEISDLAQSIRENSTAEADTSEDDASDEAETQEEDTYYLELYEAMVSQNADYVGWITIADTNIDYPIVQCDDNSYYLSHSFYGEELTSGTLFVDCSISEGMEAKHVIVYGHNMKNMSMFAHLKKFRNEEFYLEHKTFEVWTATGAYTYEIFAVYVTDPDSDTYTIGFGDDEVFMDYIEKMQSQSIYDTGVTVDITDKIITLSTCVNSNVDRLVVQARRIE